MRSRDGRLSVILVLALASVVTLATVARASDAERSHLAGWGPFKFGMTILQARMAGGSRATFGGHYTIRYSTMIGGAPYEATVYFTGVGGDVNDIALYPRNAFGNPLTERADTQEACFARHAQLVTRVSAKYGSPNEEHDKPYVVNSVRRQSVYRFKDGSEIDVNTTYYPVLKECGQVVEYLAAAKAPEESF